MKTTRIVVSACRFSCLVAGLCTCLSAGSWADDADAVGAYGVLPAPRSFDSVESDVPNTASSSSGATSLSSSDAISIMALDGQPSVITNSAEVWTCLEPDPDSTPGNSVPEEDDQSQAVLIVEEADLRLAKFVSAAFVHQGSNVTFTVTVTNQGFCNATGVTVRDALPSGMLYVSSTGGLYNPATGVWTIGVLSVGNSISLQITATAIMSGTITNVAEVETSDQHDPDSTPGNANPSEDDYGSVTVICVAPNYVLTKKVVSPSVRPAVVGETVIFEVSVTNTGNVALNTIRLDDSYNPAFLSFLNGTPPPVPAGGGSVTWSNVGPLTAGASLTVTARFTAVASTLPGATTNTVISAVTQTNNVPVLGQTAKAAVQVVAPGVVIKLEERFISAS